MHLLSRYLRPCDGAAHGSAVYNMEFVTADLFLKDLCLDLADRIRPADPFAFFAK